MTTPNLATKAELKKKYGISNDDFRILIRPNKPTEEELRTEGAVLEPVPSWRGFQTFLIRVGAVVVAVFLLPARISNFRDDVALSLDVYGSVFEKFHKLPTPPYTMADIRGDLYMSSSNVATVIVSKEMATPPPRGV